jgi:hypothetical protein
MCFTGVNDTSETYITRDSDCGNACITGIHSKTRSFNIFVLYWSVRHDLSDVADTSCLTGITYGDRSCILWQPIEYSKNVIKYFK